LIHFYKRKLFSRYIREMGSQYFEFTKSSQDSPNFMLTNFDNEFAEFAGTKSDEEDLYSAASQSRFGSQATSKAFNESTNTPSQTEVLTVSNSSPHKIVMSSTTSPEISPSTPPAIDLPAHNEGHAASLLLSQDDHGLPDPPPALHDEPDALVVTAGPGDAPQALDNRVDHPPPLQSPPLTYDQIRENNIREKTQLLFDLGLDKQSRQLNDTSKLSRKNIKKSRIPRPQISSSPPVLRSEAAKSHCVPSPQPHDVSSLCSSPAGTSTSPPAWITGVDGRFQRRKRQLSPIMSSNLCPPATKGNDDISPPQPQGKKLKLPGPTKTERLFNPDDPFGDGMNLDEMSTFCAKKVINRPGYRHTWNHFCAHLGEEMVAKLKAGDLTNSQVDNLVSEYFRTRVNIKVENETGHAQRLDTSTMATLVSQLHTNLSAHTPYNIKRDRDCHKWRGVLQYVLQQAKKDGFGRLANQPSPLRVQEINYLFQHDSISVWSPRGLQQLLLLHLTTTFNVRVEEEVRSIRLGDFRHVANKDGEVVYTVLLPRNTKKDTGVKLMTKNSKAYKRPVSVRRTNLAPSDMKFDLVYVLKHLRYHLAKLQLPDDLDDLTLFWKIKGSHLRPNEGFYLAQKLGIISFKYLVKDMMSSTGLDDEGRLISNQSLRTSTINLQSAAGLTLQQMSTINGHIDPNTARIYMRGDAESMAKHGASIQGAATGLPVASLPDFGEVRLRDGTMVRPRSVLTTTETGQGLVSVVEQSIADTVVPETLDITADKRFHPYPARQQDHDVESSHPDLDMTLQPQEQQHDPPLA